MRSLAEQESEQITALKVTIERERDEATTKTESLTNSLNTVHDACLKLESSFVQERKLLVEVFLFI